ETTENSVVFFIPKKPPTYKKPKALIGAFKNNQKYRRKISRSGRTEENKESRRPEAECTWYMSIGLTQMTQFFDVSSRFAESVDGS
ncbi:hypothetical protein SFC08_18720, partial [Lysinibacillus halotolerans]